MASKFSFDEFNKAVAAAGLQGGFSDADMKLAQRNPDAGMSLLRYKQDYRNATTDEARALANLGAEGVRSSMGGYAGGTDGSGFYMTSNPGGFMRDEAPSFTFDESGNIADLYAKQAGYGSFNYDIPEPTYNNRYDGQIQDVLQRITNRPDFQYNAEADPLYSQYRKAYTREGQRATQDALGAASAMTGGVPSSYAATAAAQAGDYYAGQMADKIPELYQLAYNQYMNEHNMRLADLGALQSAEQSDYDKYLNQMNQWNTNRNFDYNAFMDEYNRINNDLNTAQGIEQLRYTKYLNDLNQHNTEQAFRYGQWTDEYNAQQARDAQEYQQKYNSAVLAAQYGDYTGLNELGIAPNMGNMNSAALAGAGKYATGTNGTERTGSGGGGGYNNGGLTGEQIKELQNALGVTADGMWGSQSTTAAGGMSAQEAWDAYQAGNLGENATLTTEQTDYLKGYFGTTELTEEQWQEALATGISDSAMHAAGFTMKGELNAQIEEQAQEKADVKDYETGTAYMKNAGVDAGTIAGMMTRGEWTRRKSSLQTYGQGGAEVKNYDSYADYVKDYVQYATGK